LAPIAAEKDPAGQARHAAMPRLSPKKPALHMQKA
jgi:hypothetical protein